MRKITFLSIHMQLQDLKPKKGLKKAKFYRFGGDIG